MIAIEWAAGMTTAPRKGATIQHALMAARLNDWEPTIFAEPNSDLEGIDAPIVQHTEKLGIWFNWVFAARHLLEQNPSATHILTMQDDCVLVPNARRLVESWEWPADAGLLSLYLPPMLTRHRNKRHRPRGIHRSPQNDFHGSLAVVYQRDMLAEIIEHRIAKRWGQSAGPRGAASVKDDDICVGTVLYAIRRKLYYAWPSCSQHIGYSTRPLGGAPIGTRCADWVALDAIVDCREDFSEPANAC